jgi:hypothetical protein
MAFSQKECVQLRLLLHCTISVYFTVAPLPELNSSHVFHIGIQNDTLSSLLESVQFVMPVIFVLNPYLFTCNY